jgi:hypothetical protein
MKWKRRLAERLHADERVYLTSWLQGLRDMAMNVLVWIYGLSWSEAVREFLNLEMLAGNSCKLYRRSSENRPILDSPNR